MNSRNFFSVDLGATSGRTILATFDGMRVEMTEVTRFANPMIPLGGHLYWDIAGLYNEVLRGLREEEILKNINNLRRNVGDRAVLRSLHFLRENDRVEKIKDALLKNDIDTFFTEVKKSGDSSFKYLQNVYTNANVKEQGISLALALADGYLQDKSGAFRVHGGGFAGTVQAFVKNGDVHGYVELMDSVFGDGATEVFTVRDRGAVRLF